MIRETRANLARLGHPFSFAQADAQALPFRDASFDAVIANHMLYHVPDISRSLGEVRRVLKPSGGFAQQLIFALCFLGNSAILWATHR
jgi:ubiquinone/menaquinone biosynthesis C-methylase UbiE